jgi:hypothetical protein
MRPWALEGWMARSGGMYCQPRKQRRRWLGDPFWRKGVQSRRKAAPPGGCIGLPFDNVMIWFIVKVRNCR